MSIFLNFLSYLKISSICFCQRQFSILEITKATNEQYFSTSKHTRTPNTHPYKHSLTHPQISHTYNNGWSGFFVARNTFNSFSDCAIKHMFQFVVFVEMLNISFVDDLGLSFLWCRKAR